MAEPDQNVAEPDQITVEPNQSMAEPDQTIVKPNEGTAEQEIVGQPEYILPEEEEEQKNDTVAGSGKRWPEWVGVSVFRLLVPSQKVGSILGRKGEVIKKICNEAKAHIKIINGPSEVTESVVMVSAKEEPHSPVPPALQCLLRVHKRVVDGLVADSLHAPSSGVKVTTRLLVPNEQAEDLRGKKCTTALSIREESNCIVRVLPTEELSIFAIQDDKIVEIVGEPLAVRKALEMIASRQRKFLVDCSVIPVFETQMRNPQEHLPPPQSRGLPPQGFPPNVSGGPGYVVGSHFTLPRQHENYYTPADMLPLDKRPHQGVSAYGREARMALHSSNNQPAPFVVTWVIFF